MMSDFLFKLLARSYGAPPAIRPRTPARFESVAGEPFAGEIAVAQPATHPIVHKPPVESSAHQPRTEPLFSAPDEPGVITFPTLPVAPPLRMDRLDQPPVFQPTPVAPATQPELPLKPPPERHATPLLEVLNQSHAVERVPVETPVITPRDAPREQALPIEHTETPATRVVSSLPPAIQPSIRPADIRIAPAAPPTPAPVIPSNAAPPHITITIGRVEVRAMPPNAPAARRAATPSAPAMSLDDYLKRRDGGAS